MIRAHDVRAECWLKIICYLERSVVTEIAQRIFKHSDIQYNSLTLDKTLNSLICRTLF